MEKDKVYVFEGKTTTEAIEKGLKQLKVSKNKVDIKILKERLCDAGEQKKLEDKKKTREFYKNKIPIHINHSYAII